MNELERLIDYKDKTDKFLRERSEEFYLDEKNSMEDRIRMFNMFGKHFDFCIDFKNSRLQAIFEYLNHECDYFRRYESVHIENIIESWIDLLYDNKYKIGKDRYNDESIVKYDERNYIPSEKAEKRYEEYLYKLFFKEKIASFTLSY